MSANPKFVAATAHVDEAAVQPLPKSRKILRRRIAARPPRADARDHAVGHARDVRRREEPAADGLRHLGPVHRPDREDRHPLGPRGAARAVDRRARRHRGTRGAELRLRRRAPARPEARRTALQPEAPAAPRGRGRERHADALRAPRHRHAGDGVHRHPREPADGRPFGDAAAASTRATTSAPRCRRRSRPSSCATKSRAAAPSSRRTSITRRPSR